MHGMIHFARNSEVGWPRLAVTCRAGVPDLPQIEPLPKALTRDRAGEVVKANPDIRDFSVFLLDGRMLVGPTPEKFPTGRVDDATLSLIRKTVEVDVRPLPGKVMFVKSLVAGHQTLGGVRFALDTSALETESLRP